MDRISLVKIVTPDPEAVERFMREVVDVPGGWEIGGFERRAGEPLELPTPGRGPDGDFTAETVHVYRGASERGGLISGSPESRQLQILEGPQPKIWAVGIATRHLEDAYERARKLGYRCTVPEVVPWGDGGMRFFYAEVGGVIFEVMRVEESKQG